MIRSTFAVTGLLLALATSVNLHAGVIYNQNFDSPNTGSGNGDALALYNWAAHRGGNGANSITPNGWPTDPLSSNSSQMRVVDDAGAPSGTDRVFSFWNDGVDGQDLLTWTDDFSPVAQASYNNLAISWFQRDSGAAKQRAAVAVDTGVDILWYAADLKTNTSSSWVQQTASLEDAIWIPFTFDGSQTTDSSAGFDVSGTPGALPAGSIVAAGIYLELGENGSARFDTFELSGDLVPEPASLALLALGSLLMTRRSQH